MLKWFKSDYNNIDTPSADIFLKDELQHTKEKIGEDEESLFGGPGSREYVSIPKDDKSPKRRQPSEKDISKDNQDRI